jgi:4'-phosphopantetheinyl transferase
MIRLFYYNINAIADSEIEFYLLLLPDFMREDIRKYRNFSDQKVRLIARLMLLQCMQEEHVGDLIHKFKKDSDNKPYVEGWNQFNISHSAEMVVFCHSSENVGIDIEKKIDFNFQEVIDFLHPEEIQYIKIAENQCHSFYEVWVKKEAILKASGIGIINGMNAFSCVADVVNVKELIWYLHHVDLQTDYTCYISSLNKNDKIVQEEFILHLNS